MVRDCFTVPVMLSILAYSLKICQAPSKTNSNVAGSTSAIRGSYSLAIRKNSCSPPCYVLLVAQVGLEPTNLSVLVSKTSAFTISPLGRTDPGT